MLINISGKYNWDNKEDQRLTEIALVMECEWEREAAQIWYDFEKQRQARAEHKVKIVQTETIAEKNGLFEEMKRRVQTFTASRAGDRYLLVFYVRKNEQFRFELFVN